MADHDPASDDLLAPLRAAAAGARVAAPDDVRRRGDRRTRNTRLVAGAAVLVLCAGTGAALAASSGPDESLRPPPIATSPTSTATPTATPSATPSPGATGAPVATATGTPSSAPATRPGGAGRPAGSPSSAAATARLTVDLVRTSAPGAAHVSYTAHISGLVPQLSDALTGSRISGSDQLLGTHVQFGDGAVDGSDGGQVTCRPGTPLVPLDMTFATNAGHDYAPGSYTLTFEARACGLDATDTLPVTVAAPATVVTQVGPVDAAGDLRPGYTVTTTAAADSCSAGSDLFGGVYRCSAGNGVYDPCWASAASPLEVLCLASPFSTTVSRLTVSTPLDPPGAAGTPDPWGLVLDGAGVQCTLLQGAHDQFQGRPVDYGCNDGTVVLRGLDRSGPTWSASRARSSGGSYTALPPAPVTTAYLPLLPG